MDMDRVMGSNSILFYTITGHGYVYYTAKDNVDNRHRHGTNMATWKLTWN